jgi:pimeloyl-ACP methyl ester carboxylesterase
MKLKINELTVFTEGDKTKQAIIFVHGFPYDHTMWNNQINYFKNDYYCIAYDVRGLGNSAVGDGQYTMEQYVDDLFEIINVMELSNPVLCGLSMGGYISFRAMEREQRIFKSVIFCDTKSQADSDEIKLVRANKIKQINTEGLAAFTNEFVAACFGKAFQSNSPDIFNKIKTRSTTYNPIGVKGALIAMLSRTDSTKFLPELKIPALLLAGEHDEMTPPTLMKELANIIPNSKFETVPNSGHMSPVENPDFVNKKIKEFLND